MRSLNIFLATCWLATGPLHAEVYELPPEGYDVIGNVSTITARYEDTLVDIARRHGLGYYDLDGVPLRKMFLRSPLKFSRVTSRFSMNRYHPVLKRRMPHYGVDYGAPEATLAVVEHDELARGHGPLLVVENHLQRAAWPGRAAG